jgi:iron complex outermembrane receptor protein
MHPPVHRNRFIPPCACAGFRLALWALGALLALPAGAQSAAPSGAAKEDAIVLSPFEVSTSKDIGYQANDTLAGSRLRTNLTDVANAVSVFTPEFMHDVNAFSEADLMRYSASAVPERTDQTASAQGISIDTGGFQYRIRGQLATRSRNYFGTSLVPDTYNAERFEEARGPNAILFGLGGAGGILNTTIKTARIGRTFGEVDLTTGSDNLLRTQLDYNQRLNDHLAVRLNAVYHTSDGWQEHQFGDNRRVHGAVTYRPWDKLTVRLEAEYGHVENTLSRFYAPFDNVSRWKLAGSPEVSGLAAANAALGIGKRNATQRVTFIGNDDTLHNFQQTVFSQPLANRVNSVILPGDWSWIAPGELYPQTAAFSGPGGTSELKQKLFGATVEIAPLKNLNIELAAINDLRDQDVYDTTNEVFRVIGEPGRTYRDGAANPYAGDYYVDTRWVLRRERNSGERYRGTISYQLDLGKWFGHHNLAGMISRDYTGNPRSVGFLVLDGAPFNPQPQNAANQIWTRQYITDPNDPNQFAAPDFRRIPKTFSVVMNQGDAPRTFNTSWADNELNDQWQHIDNRFASLQSYFLDDRIVTTVGYRYTEQTSYARPTNATLPSFSNSPLRFTGAPATGSAYDFERLSYGIVAKPFKWLSTYYNYSENAQIPGSTQTLIPNSTPFPLNSGKGKDYGVMLSLLKGRVFIRAGYFTTASVDQASAFGASNVSVRNDRIMDAELAAKVITAAQSIRFSGGDFDLADLATNGYEVNLTANLTPEWRLMVNLSKSNAVTSNMLKRSRPAAAQVLPLWQLPAAQNLVTTAGVTVAQEILNYQAWLATTTAVENSGTIGHRQEEARVFTRYDFRQSFLKGVFVGGGFSYGSAPVVGRSTSGALFYAPIRREADALVGYRTRLPKFFGRYPIEFQLNATNLLQQSPYVVMDRQPDGEIFRAQLQAPTQYTFTTRITF